MTSACPVAAAPGLKVSSYLLDLLGRAASLRAILNCGAFLLGDRWDQLWSH